MSWTKEIQAKMLEEIIPQLEKEIFQLNDHLAKNPELGSCEFQSSKRIVELLRSHGIQVEYPFCGLETAFKATVNPGGERKAALLAEYDALPNMGHACGHCASGMASVTAALALNTVKDQLGSIQIDLIGTPDEELEGRKAVMAAAHVFDDYDFAAMVHMNGHSTLDTNFVALDGMIFEFRGRAAHAAAAPEKGRNALNAVRLLFDSVDMMRQHVIQEARIHGYISDGGVAANIVPDYACAKFLTRAPHRSDLDDITAWVKDCAKAAALATRTELNILPYGDSMDDLYVGPEKYSLLDDCFRELGLPLVKEETSQGGSSDIGNVDYVCPAFHPMMGIGQELNLHTPEFGQAMTDPRTHEAILNGARVLLQLCFQMYQEPGQLERIQKEFAAHRGK